MAGDLRLPLVTLPWSGRAVPEVLLRRGEATRFLLVAAQGTVEVELRVTKDGKPEIFIDSQPRGLLLTDFEHWRPLE